MQHPRLIIAGTHSGSGKTSVCLALMAALACAGYDVQGFKVGPDFIDPGFHDAVMQHYKQDRRSHNLDPWLMPPETVLAMFSRYALTMNGMQTARHSGLSLIEGVMGLFDGMGDSAFASTAHVASLLRAPVLLVINVHGLSLSSAALVNGYVHFRPRMPEPDLSSLAIAGVILNHVSNDRHYAILRRCIEQNTAVPCVGYLKKNALPPLPHRHLGLIQAGELPELHSYWDSLARTAEQSFDLQRIVELAAAAPSLPSHDTYQHSGPQSFASATHDSGQALSLTSAPADDTQTTPTEDACTPCGTTRSSQPLRIGIARDEAFSFYYPDALASLEEAGATLVPFSPLHDAALPAGLDGLYIGGGYPETFAGQLQANSRFRATLLAALEDGLPAYAECGGMLYLCTSLVCEPRLGTPSIAMTGFFPVSAAMCDSLQPFGYVTVTTEHDCLLGPRGTRLHGHEFHYSRLMLPTVEANTVQTPVFTMTKADGRSWAGGMAKKNVLASYAHLHFRGCPEAASNFLAACRTTGYRTSST